MWSIIAAGLSGAVASILGKISLSSDFPPLQQFSFMTCRGWNTSWNCAFVVSLAARIVIFALMLTSNGYMLSRFLKALETKGTLPVTVVCSAVNFILTGVLSYFVLNERINSQWISGATLIVVGICFILISQGSLSQKRFVVKGDKADG